MSNEARKVDRDEERTNESLDRLERTVSRFCVLLERILAANDQAAERSRKFLASMSPADVTRMQEEVRRKMAAHRGKR